MSPVFQYRAAAAADAGVIRALAETIWREYYPSIISTAQIEYMLDAMYAREVIQEELARGVVWEIVSLSGEPVGFLSFTRDEASRSMVLHKLYTLPRLHGHGIGRAMLERVKTAAGRGEASSIRLRVNKRNTRAIRAYERAGFHRVGAVVDDIGGGFVMDDYVMVLELPGRQSSSL